MMGESFIKPLRFIWSIIRSNWLGFLLIIACVSAAIYVFQPLQYYPSLWLGLETKEALGQSVFNEALRNLIFTIGGFGGFYGIILAKRRQKKFEQQVKQSQEEQFPSKLNNCLKALQEGDILHHTLGVSLLGQLLIEAPDDQVSSIKNIIHNYIISKTNKPEVIEEDTPETDQNNDVKENIPSTAQNIDFVKQQENKLISLAINFLLNNRPQKGHGIDFRELCFSNISLKAIQNVQFLSINKCDFKNSFWCEVDIKGTWITSCKFEEVDFQPSNFNGCIIRSCNFNKSDFNMVSFKRANFQHCNFNKVEMQNSDLSEAKFFDFRGDEIKFEQCNFIQCEFDIQSFLEISAKDSDLSNAKIFLDIYLPSKILPAHIENYLQTNLDTFLFEIGQEPVIKSRFPEDLKVKTSVKPNPDRAYEWVTINKKKYRRFVNSRKWIDQPYRVIHTHHLGSDDDLNSRSILAFINRRKKIWRERKSMLSEEIYELNHPPKIIASHPDYERLLKPDPRRAYEWVEIEGQKYRRFALSKEWIDEPPE